MQNFWPWLTSILRTHLWGNTLIETLSKSHILASPTLDLLSLVTIGKLSVNIKNWIKYFHSKNVTVKVVPNHVPLQAQCLKKSIIYKAKVKSDTDESTYIGLAGNTFKERYTNHKSSFRNRTYCNTALSKHIWSLKDNNSNYTLEWSSVTSAPTYTPQSKKCHLCNIEKTEILLSTDINLLNKKTEIMNKCRHRNKFLLSAIT